MSLVFEWTGRVDENSESKRLHQIIKNKKCEELEKAEGNHFGFIGFESDEGVKRNKGRTGAALAPNKIRKLLDNIHYHPNKENIIDIGNVSCTDQNLESAQQRLGEKIAQLINHHYTPII